MIDGGVSTILEMTSDYPLHRLGWKAFHDLCVAAAKGGLRRPVQTFFPTNDAGRDGAFIGRWDGGSSPDDYSEQSEDALKSFHKALADKIDEKQILMSAQADISHAISSMNEEYQPSLSTSTPTASLTPQNTPLANLFRDIDE